MTVIPSRWKEYRTNGLTCQQVHNRHRQIILLYLEDMDAGAIAEITGLKPGAIATKIHRIKALLAQRFKDGRPA